MSRLIHQPPARPTTAPRKQPPLALWLGVLVATASGLPAGPAHAQAPTPDAQPPSPDAARATRPTRTRAQPVDDPAEATRLPRKSTETTPRPVVEPGLDAAVARAERRCVGLPVRRVSLVGCVGTRCQQPRERDKLISLLDLPEGHQLAAGELALGRTRLMATGFFFSALPQCAIKLGEAFVSYRVRGNNVIRRIRFEGNAALFTNELQARLLLQRGDVLNPETPEGQSRLKQQIDVIERAYQRAGFEATQVRIVTRQIRVGRIEVVIVIEEGDKQRIAERIVRLHGVHEPNADERAAGLRCHPVSPREVLNQSGLVQVDVLTRRGKVKARSRLRRYLRALGYANPDIQVDHRHEDNTLLLNVTLGRCAQVTIMLREEAHSDATRGYRRSDDEVLYGVLPFAESGRFDLDEAELAREDLLAALENRGYLFADVRLDFRRVPRTTSEQVTTAITYYVTTGHPAQIRGIRFVGARHFSPAELAAVLGTKAYDFFDDGGYLQRGLLFADLEKLRQFYRNAGFFQFRFGLSNFVERGRELPAEEAAARDRAALTRRRRETRDATVMEFILGDKGFRIRRPHGEPFIYVEIPVREGLRSRLRSVNIRGAEEIDDLEVRRLMALRTGDVAAFSSLVDGVKRLEARYRNDGYFRARIEAKCSTTGPPRDKAPCSQSQILAEAVDLHIEIIEGERVRMGEVFVAGNFETDLGVITRDLPREGEIFSSRRLFKVQRSLRNLGLFRSVRFQYIGAGEDDTPVRDKIALIVHVVEDTSQFVDVAVGFQTANTVRNLGSDADGAIVDFIEHVSSGSSRLGIGYGQRVGIGLSNLLFTGEVAYLDKNFLGSGNSLRLPLKVGVTLQPSLALVTALPTFVNPRLFGSDWSLRIIAPYFIQDFATTAIDLRKTGAFSEISRRFGKLALSFGLDVGAASWQTSQSLLNTGNLDPFRFQAKLMPRLTWDNLDNPLNPTRGFFATGYVGYIQAVDATSDGQLRNFLKYESTLKAFLTIRSTVTIAMLARAGGGLPLGRDDTQLPANERFRIGGTHGLRGYIDDGIRQYDKRGRIVTLDTDGDGVDDEVASDGDVVVNGSLELRFPLARGAGLWGATFWDWGGIAEDWSDMHAASVRHGLGLGLRWLVANQIPVRVDYGFAVSQRCQSLILDDTGQPTDGCNIEPAGQFHAGLLYAF